MFEVCRQSALCRVASREEGFTVTELVIVLVLVGALAFIAIPRLNLTSVQLTPLAESVAAELRYTQSLAMTRSQPHTFSIGSGSYSISQGGSGVALSSGEAARSYDPDVSVASTTVTFSPRFGQPDGGATITISGGGESVAVIVEQETGYVYVQE